MRICATLVMIVGPPAAPTAMGLYHATPMTFLLSAAASRQPQVWPRPLWALLLWPGLAAATTAVNWLIPRAHKETPRANFPGR